MTPSLIGKVWNEDKKYQKHGMSHTKFYETWHRMKNRCLNSKIPGFENYGGRGIKVCDEWLYFMNFYEDMYPSFLRHIKQFGQRQTTLDRIDNNLGYYLENCRWATYKIQINNRRPTKEKSYFYMGCRNGKGYCKRKDNGKFSSQISVKNKKINIGTFNTEEEAKLAYFNKLKELQDNFNPLLIN